MSQHVENKGRIHTQFGRSFLFPAVYRTVCLSCSGAIYCPALGWTEHLAICSIEAFHQCCCRLSTMYSG